MQRLLVYVNDLQYINGLSISKDAAVMLISSSFPPSSSSSCLSWPLRLF